MEMEGEGSGKASPPCNRGWAELQRDVLMLIFLKVGLRGVLGSAGSVCRSWRKVAKDEPDLWRKIDMANQGYVRGITRLSKLKAVTRIAKLKGMTRLAIDRSMGRLEEFSIRYFADDSILQYLCDRTTVLKKLCLISCWQLSDEAIAETAKRQPLLEELQITFGSFHGAATEIVGKECPQLKSFKFNISQYKTDSYDDAALGIAKTMHQLCHTTGKKLFCNPFL